MIFIFMESSSNTNVLYTPVPLGSMQVNSMLDLTSSDFLFFSVAVRYRISCFHSFRCSQLFLLKLSSCGGLNLMFPLKWSSCGGLNLSIPDWLSLLNLNFHFRHHVKIFSGLSKGVQSESDFWMLPLYRWLITDNKLW